MIASAGVLALFRAREDRRLLLTGPARWIWCTRPLGEPRPVRFRAWKDFRIDGSPPARAPARLFGARDWILEVNGESVASGTQGPGDPLRVVDLAPRLRSGENRISIETGSLDGAGGLLFWMDLGGGKILASDGTWRAQRLPFGSEPEHAAIVWGRPPMYPWGYPRLP